MSRRVTFQFDEDLDYQQQAVKSVIELFRGLPRQVEGIYHPERIRRIDESDPIRNPDIVVGSRLLENLRNVQLQNGLFADSALAGGNNFTIEMETGTGKTYVYLRTILELYKEYQFKKFIIVVPSIAIRKGVEKSMEQLQDHFKRLYDIDLSKHCFVYDNNHPRQVRSRLVESDGFCLCVMNIQAFNKDTNKIRTKDEYGQILWEDIQYIKPIVVIDEPQKIEGTVRNKSKSFRAIEELKPLFVLRYSATHKQLYNQIYKLDSFGAYQKDLVKRIEVKTVHGVIPKEYPYIRYLSFTSDLKAKIEIFSQKQGGIVHFQTFQVGGGASLRELSGNLLQYKDMRIAEEPHKLKPLQIASKDKIIELAEGHSTYEIDQSEAVRIQIRLAIKNHFTKQINILRTGKKIKALALFFIDSVDKVRAQTAPDGRGEYLKIFDEEYEKYILQNAAMIEEFREYFPEYQNVQSVREGYFALDARRNVVEVEGWNSSADEGSLKIKAKSQEDIDRGISLILERKDELISFEEPLAFIFSHSALREGWDNPNVFTLCTLKSNGSEIAKKQEIGRGLRLPVDIAGNRCLDCKINELTIIANDSYDHFAAALQKDFNDNMNYDKNEVTAEILIATLKTAGVLQEKITPKLVDTFKQELILAGVMSEKHILSGTLAKISALLDNIVFSNNTLYEHTKMIKQKFRELMIQKGTRKIEIRNGDNMPYENKMRAFVTQGEFGQIYLALREHLTKRTMYRCRFDKDKFIGDCAAELNRYLLFAKAKNEYQVETGRAKYDAAAMLFVEAVSHGEKALEFAADTAKKSDFEIVNYIMYHTMLPRLAVWKLLRAVEKRELLNNQDILDTVTQKIQQLLENTKAANIISYEVINGYELDSKDIFALDTVTEKDFYKEWGVFWANPNHSSAMNQYYKMDSREEKEFAEKLENNQNVLLFTKLKKGGFTVDTPHGRYTPDWVVVCKKDGLKNPQLGIYFIVEIKAGRQDMNLQEIERDKIRCCKLHFQAVSDQIRFDWVNSYEDFRQKFGVAKSE